MQDPLRIVTLHKEDTETVIQTDKGAEELLLPSDLEKEQEKAEKKDNKEDKKRAEHEAAEANRKEEWKAKQQAKRIAEQEQLNHLRAMNNDEVTTASLRRVSADTERLTRRNMKECVSEHIQTLCLDSPDFARLVMHPKKNMIHCFRYIYRKAKAFIEQDMKEEKFVPRQFQSKTTSKQQKADQKKPDKKQEQKKQEVSADEGVAGQLMLDFVAEVKAG